MKEFFIGVDGGATKSILVLEDENGATLGRRSGAAANIRISVEQSWQAILTTLYALLGEHNLCSDDIVLHAAMGLAGCELTAARQQFLSSPHPFKSLAVTSDAHIACLGAHAGADGVIIVIGTGVVGYQIDSDKVSKVSGWGFPHDDIGGGAWLGLEAVKHTVQTVDGRQRASALSAAILQHFNNDMTQLVTWANNANSSQFAELAPLVTTQAENGDNIAAQLLQQSADAVYEVYRALGGASLPVALIGGIAPFIQAKLPDALQKRLVNCQRTPDAGAVMLARSRGNNHGGQ